MNQSTKNRSADKPDKPYDDFPLFPHATGLWAKKIKGKLRYFGPWHDPEKALNKYLEQRDDLYAGRKPRAKGEGGATIKVLVNQFLNAKRLLVESGELTPRTFADYEATGKRVSTAFGSERLVLDLAADDFDHLRGQIAKLWGPTALGNEIARTRVLFKYAYDAGLIDRPVRYGPHFKRPSKKILRRQRHAKGPRMFEAATIRKLLETAGPTMKAMILLGVNCGFGNTDVGLLPTKAVDLKAAWVDYPRPKTEMPRRCPLWPETVKAVREAIAARPAHADEADAGLLFITKYGKRWAKQTKDSPVSQEFRKLLVDLKAHRNGLGFYTLRHVFETIGGESRDQIAVDAIMGHAPHGNDMASVYRERIGDDRLMAVVEHVRGWLFPPKVKRPK